MNGVAKALKDLLTIQGMDRNLFSQGHGVIMAIDTREMDDIRYIVDVCNENTGITALKIGGLFMGLWFGVRQSAEMLRSMTRLPLIYDGQKLGVNPPIPDTTEGRAIRDDMYGGMDGVDEGEFYGRLIGEAGIDGGIAYPCGDFIVPASPNDARVQRSFTDSFRRNNVTPFILGRPTWKGVLRSEGGFFPDDMPEKIYRGAAESGVEYYIMPGNRPDETRRYVDIVRAVLPAEVVPKICMPGFGKQGGRIETAFAATRGLPSYAIIGPCDCFDITDRQKVAEHIRRYCGETLAFE
jgi:hypothetical protein